MATEEAVIQVFKVFMTLPDAQKLLTGQQPLPADFFLKDSVVAKELFSHEPGAAVNYQAIKEKIKVLEPHFKVTSSGPALMAFFAELREQHNMWAVAFAQYVSHTIMFFMFEQTLYGRPLNVAERDALNPQGPQTVLGDSLKAAATKLAGIKGSREFAQYVHILEECVKKHKTHLRRRAQAENARKVLTEKRKVARKTKKTASASPVVPAATQQIGRDRSAFNPDLPDFAQFMHCFTTPAAPAAPAAPVALAAPVVPAVRAGPAAAEVPQEAPSAPVYDLLDVELEKALRAYLEEPVLDSLPPTNDVSLKPLQVAEQATLISELDSSISGEVDTELTQDEHGACFSSPPPAYDAPSLELINSTEQTPADSDMFNPTNFDMDNELFNGGFGAGVSSYDPLFDDEPTGWQLYKDPDSRISAMLNKEDERYLREFCGMSST